MPDPTIPDEQVDSLVDEQNASASQKATEGMAAAVPPATEPLMEDKLNSLAAMVSSAADKLSGGQMEDLGIPEVSGDQQAMDPQLFNALGAFSAFAQDAGLEDFAFDPTELATTNAGIDEMTALISQMGSDPAVQKATRMPAQAQQTETPEEPASDRDLDAFV